MAHPKKKTVIYKKEIKEELTTKQQFLNWQKMLQQVNYTYITELIGMKENFTTEVKQFLKKKQNLQNNDKVFGKIPKNHGRNIEPFFYES